MNTLGTSFPFLALRALLALRSLFSWVAFRPLFTLGTCFPFLTRPSLFPRGTLCALCASWPLYTLRADSAVLAIHQVNRLTVRMFLVNESDTMTTVYWGNNEHGTDSGFPCWPLRSRYSLRSLFACFSCISPGAPWPFRAWLPLLSLRPRFAVPPVSATISFFSFVAFRAFQAFQPFIDRAIKALLNRYLICAVAAKPGQSPCELFSHSNHSTSSVTMNFALSIKVSTLPSANVI